VYAAELFGMEAKEISDKSKNFRKNLRRLLRGMWSAFLNFFRKSEKTEKYFARQLRAEEKITARKLFERLESIKKEKAKKPSGINLWAFFMAAALAIFYVLMSFGQRELQFIGSAASFINLQGSGLVLGKILIAIAAAIGLFYSTKYLARGIRSGALRFEIKNKPKARQKAPEKGREIVIPKKIVKKIMETEAKEIQPKQAREPETNREKILNELKEVYK
jgi:hypothetical protein